jgi:hypothetical protein
MVQKRSASAERIADLVSHKKKEISETSTNIVASPTTQEDIDMGEFEDAYEDEMEEEEMIYAEEDVAEDGKNLTFVDGELMTLVVEEMTGEAGQPEEAKEEEAEERVRVSPKAMTCP